MPFQYTCRACFSTYATPSQRRNPRYCSMACQSSTAAQIGRFWEKVDKNGPIPAHRPELGPCWIWIGGTVHHGYGSVWFGGKVQRSNRVSWIIHYGPIPAGYAPCHQCDNPPCIRPDHLFLGTQKQNVHDMIAKGRSGSFRLTDSEIEAIRDQYAAGGVLQRELAAQFGVTQSHISAIVQQRRRKASM